MGEVAEGDINAVKLAMHKERDELILEKSFEGEREVSRWTTPEYIGNIPTRRTLNLFTAVGLFQLQQPT